MALSDHHTIHSDRWSEARFRQPALADARSLTAAEAAQLLHVSCATLRTWEDDFGFPTAITPSGSPPRYPVAQLLALREALDTSASIASAMQTARHRLARTP